MESKEKYVHKLTDMTYEEMCDMELNQVHSTSKGDIICVPGGWLYTIKVPGGNKSFYANPVFVPYFPGHPMSSK